MIILCDSNINNNHPQIKGIVNNKTHRFRPKALAMNPAAREPTNWPKLHMLAEKKVA